MGRHLIFGVRLFSWHSMNRAILGRQDVASVRLIHHKNQSCSLATATYKHHNINNKQRRNFKERTSFSYRKLQKKNVRKTDNKEIKKNNFPSVKTNKSIECIKGTTAIDKQGEQHDIVFQKGQFPIFACKKCCMFLKPSKIGGAMYNSDNY